jgi:hypothetical protein
MLKNRESNWYGIFVVAMTVWVFAAWFTHVFVCLKSSAWGFLVAGAIFFPVAWVHGTGIWLGVW